MINECLIQRGTQNVAVSYGCVSFPGMKSVHIWRCVSFPGISTWHVTATGGGDGHGREG